MNVPGLVHPNLLDHVAGLFSQSCAIQAATVAQDGIGAESKSWANVAGMTAIPCHGISESGGGEVKGGDRTVTYYLSAIALKGYYPAITTAHRAIVGATTYDILNVGHSARNVYTSLTVQAVTG